MPASGAEERKAGIMASISGGVREFREDVGGGQIHRYRAKCRLVEWSESNRRLVVPRGASASDIAAKVLARRFYGKSGAVGAIRCDSWREDGSAYSYEAFIGRGSKSGGINGHNVRFTIYS
jgi:hypothetical protein